MSAASCRAGRSWPTWIVPVLLAAGLSACGGGKHELTLTVRDEENVVVPGVEVRQVGSDVLLGTTDSKGLAAIEVRPRRGEALRLRLTSPKGEAGALYAFSDPEGVVQVSEQDLNAGYLRVRANRVGPGGAMGEVTGGAAGGAGATANLALASRPSGARVLVGGEERGVTPLTVPDLPAGRTVVEIHLAGYHPWARELVLFPGENADTAILQRTEITTASLAVDSDPPGASIGLDGRAMGRTPATLRDLPIGRHRVQLTLDGYEPFSTSIVLNPGEESTVQGFLRRPAAAERTDRTPGRTTSPGGATPPGGTTSPGGTAPGGTGPGGTAPSGGSEGRGGLSPSGGSDSGMKQTYSVSLRRGWAEVFVDDETVNRNITGVFSISLAPGTHRFRVRNEAAGIDVILSYEVRSGDRAQALLLDVERKAVVPRTN